MMQPMELIFFVAFVIVFILLFNVRKRVALLEQQLSQAPARSTAAEREASPSPRTAQPPPVACGPSVFGQFAHWIREDWLLKLGALLVIIAFGWLTTYAFMNNWIGPLGRIALGIIAGAIILMLGFWRIQKYIHQGGVFLVLGSTVILLTIFAARAVYGFFTPLSALAMMFLSTAFVGYASVRYNSRALALGSLILASIAPLLTASPAPDYVGLYAYLFVVILGAIWITVLTQRRELTVAALIIISLYSFPLLDWWTDKLPTLLLFAYAFAAVFYITNTAGLLQSKDKKMLPDLLTAAGNGLFLIAWIMRAAPDEWKSLIIVAWMMAFVVGAFAIFKRTNRHEPLYVYAGVGIAMLAAATSAELQGATLTIAFALESGLVAILAYALLQDFKIALRTSLLLIGPIVLSAESLFSYNWRPYLYEQSGLFHADFFVLLVLGCVLLGLGTYFRVQAQKVKNVEPGSAQINGLLLITGSLYFYALLWLSLHAVLLEDSATMISLAVYTVIGLATHLTGKANNQQGFKVYGGVLLGCVVARLLLIDVWSMALSGRIITFFLVGALLISTAFVGRKKKSVS